MTASVKKKAEFEDLEDTLELCRTLQWPRKSEGLLQLFSVDNTVWHEAEEHYHMNAVSLVVQEPS